MMIGAKSGLRVENGETALAARGTAIGTTSREHGWVNSLEFHFGPLFWRDADSKGFRIREKHLLEIRPPFVFCERVRNCMKRKGLSFRGVRKSAKECGN